MERAMQARLASVLGLDSNGRDFFTGIRCTRDYKVRQNSGTRSSHHSHRKDHQENEMLRTLKILTFIFALAAFAIFATSCGTDHAKVRVVQASPDAGSLDVAVDGKTVITDLAFGGLSPASGYLTVTAGNRRVEFRSSGTTTDLINSTVGFGSQKEYTLLTVGKVNPPAPPPPPSMTAALLKTDDNSPPQSGNIKLRVIHAAPDPTDSNGAVHVDVYIVAPLTDITN